jgi:hypothetical protein
MQRRVVPRKHERRKWVAPSTEEVGGATEHSGAGHLVHLVLLMLPLLGRWRN